uniref:Vacuolar protein sorting-associated protein 35 n=1 Tax=Mycena chlorophos TaxID=658473 RepID=A0ABQ0M408_MYCCL|nr:vacuolar protein sorting-associated protein 35 [Mycena chlorophos]
MEEGKLLVDSLSVVRSQTQQMKRYLELDQLMEALKSASLMLAELRTSSLSPKQYYELYMAVFDALRHLSNYLYDAHTQSRHHLADLYELVQYAGNIIPRLYLMITVGAVYMSVPDAPVKEIMKDMMEMSRGVLHPIRGLFLRHYLSGQTRDHLPVGTDDGPAGNLQDSISFVLTNFVEMNKLWVRLQHQGHSRDREKREVERRELRILVGTNLVRLSQLDGVDLDMYQQTILPGILEQVVNCKDVIAQEYLMEVVIQVFTDEFHLHSLGPFLSATAQLHPKVNIKQIVIALIDRLAAYAAREAENEDPEETKKQEEAAARRLAEKVKSQKSRARENGYGASSSLESSEWDQPAPPPPAYDASAQGPSSPATNGEQAADATQPPPATDVAKFRGVPENVQLFEVFWQQVVQLIKARPDLSIQDITALFVSLTNLSLSCYPDRLEYVDQVLTYTAEKIKEYSESPDLHAPQTTANLAALLVAPINSYQSVLTLLAIPNYAPLLTQQLFSTRRSIAHSIVSSVLKNETIIETPEDVDGVLELCHVLIKDQSDSGANPPAINGVQGKDMRRYGPYTVEREEMAEEQGWVARMVHLFRAESLDVQFELLQVARRHFDLGGERMRFTFPALITSSIKICRRYKSREHVEPEWQEKVQSILKFSRQLALLLASQVDAPAIALRLFLLAAQVADDCGFEELTYDLYVQALTVYEDCISESRAQLQAITLVIGTLEGAKVFGVDNYDTLITKVVLHAAKLLKKSHQSTAVGLASHLWWQEKSPSEGEEAPAKEPEKTEEPSENPKSFPHQDSKRVLECLQKSLRVAGAAIEEIVTVQHYCDALDHYLYYLDRGAPAVAPKFVNSLVELITSSIDNIASPGTHPSQYAPPGLIEGVQTPEMITRHFRNTLVYIQRRKNAVSDGSADSRWDDVDVVGALLKMGLGR